MSTNFKGGYAYIRGYIYSFCKIFHGVRLFRGVCLFQTLEQVILSERKGVLLPIQIITITISQGIYLVHLLCSNYDGKFKSVGCNKFTLFPILGVERSFPFPGKAATGKGFSNFGKAATGKGSFPFPGKEQFATGKGFSNFGKGKDPFLSQERSSLQLGKDSVIWESLERGKERIQTLPRKLFHFI